MPTFTEVSGSEFFNNGSLSIRLRLCTSSAAYNQVHYFIQLQKSVLNLNTGSWYPVKDQSFTIPIDRWEAFHESVSKIDDALLILQGSLILLKILYNINFFFHLG